MDFLFPQVTTTRCLAKWNLKLELAMYTISVSCVDYADGRIDYECRILVKGQKCGEVLLPRLNFLRYFLTHRVESSLSKIVIERVVDCLRIINKPRLTLNATYWKASSNPGRPKYTQQHFLSTASIQVFRDITPADGALLTAYVETPLLL